MAWVEDIECSRWGHVTTALYIPLMDSGCGSTTLSPVSGAFSTFLIIPGLHEFALIMMCTTWNRPNYYLFLLFTGCRLVESRGLDVRHADRSASFYRRKQKKDYRQNSKGKIESPALSYARRQRPLTEITQKAGKPWEQYSRFIGHFPQ